ncbi:MAG: hypothetical protein KDD36_07975 [Flavobacteriales bacterium]|nr:hypothetical protein [Flavobacteriales bacterium]
MLNLKSVITQLKPKEYLKFCAGLEENNANNYLKLVEVYRNSDENPMSDEGIRNQMELSSTAFHTMKSRLYDKLQYFLYLQFEGPGEELRLKLDALPKLIYTSKIHPHIAMAIMEHMAVVLEERSMPHELIKVYDALRRMHLQSPKYYDYSRSYNRQMAYSVALDKAYSLTLEFSRKLGEFSLSHDPETGEFVRTLRQEIKNLSRVYDSHRLRYYERLTEISYTLFFPLKDHREEEEAVDDMLKECKTLPEKHPNDPLYEASQPLVSYLSFEFYRLHKLHSKAQKKLDELQENVLDLPRLTSLGCTSFFFMSKLQWYKSQGMLRQLPRENNQLQRDGWDPELLDHITYAHYMIYMAATEYFNGKYVHAVKHLNNLQQNVMFRNMMHAEIEVKAFTILCLCMARNFAEAKDQIKSLATKLRNHNLTKRYAHVVVLMKFFRIAIKRTMVKTRYSTIKLVEYRDQFIKQNQTVDAVLPYVNWEDEYIMKRITMSTKQTVNRL